MKENLHLLLDCSSVDKPEITPKGTLWIIVGILVIIIVVLAIIMVYLNMRKEEKTTVSDPHTLGSEVKSGTTVKSSQTQSKASGQLSALFKGKKKQTKS